jgi:hypothetical protein
MSTPEEVLAETSSDATHSTYAEATDVPDENPPPGPSVEQTRGKPAEATPTRSAKTPPSSERSSS